MASNFRVRMVPTNGASGTSKENDSAPESVVDRVYWSVSTAERVVRKAGESN